MVDTIPPASVSSLPPASVSSFSMAMLSRLRPLAPGLLLLWAAGCFDYSDITTSDVTAGRDVRITLTSEGRQKLASRIGTSVRMISGRMTSVDSSTVTLALSRTTLMDGTDAPWAGEHVPIPISYIETTEQRKLSAPKTIGALAIIAGASVAAAFAIGHGSSSNASSVPGSGAK